LRCIRSLFFSQFFFLCLIAHRALHSFPTRRSSDLNNLGVPGMRMDMAEIPGMGSVNGNMYFERLLPDQDYLKTYFTYSTTQNHRSEEHTSELQSRENLVCRLLLEKKNIMYRYTCDV